MSTFGTLYCPAGHPRARICEAAAAIAGLKLVLFSGFEPNKSNRTPEFLSKFPLGQYPTFESPDSFCISEPHAIAQYIADCAPDADKKAQLLGRDAKERAKVQQWMIFSKASLETSILNLALWRIRLETYDQKTEEKYAPQLKKWMDYLENELKGKTWLIDGKGPSLADMAVMTYLHPAFGIYVDKGMREGYPEIMRLSTDLEKVSGLEDIYNGIELVEKRREPSDA